MDDSETTFKEIKDKVIEFRDKRDWKKFHTAKNLSMAIDIEVSELMEHFLWKTDEEIEEYIKDENNFKEIKEEIADVMIYCFLIAEGLDIDISEMLSNKIDKNDEKYPAEKAKGNAKKYTEL